MNANLPLPPRAPSPDFSFMGSDKNIIESAYKVIQQNEAWDLIANFKEKSFMFSKDPTIINIMDKVNEAYGGGHSGASIGMTMRWLEFIAKNGYDVFKSNMN
jgi:hypothetical protein